MSDFEAHVIHGRVCELATMSCPANDDSRNVSNGAVEDSCLILAFMCLCLAEGA